MKLTTLENRVAVLRQHGIPPELIETIGQPSPLSWMIEPPNGAYHYLPSISHYTILKGQTITPIFDRGTKFCVLATHETAQRIIIFELERDEVYHDYALNWQRLLMEVLIDYYDFSIEDGLAKDEFTQVSRSVGFKKGGELFDLRDLSVEEYNRKFGDDKAWRREIAHNLGLDTH